MRTTKTMIPSMMSQQLGAVVEPKIQDDNKSDCGAEERAAITENASDCVPHFSTKASVKRNLLLLILNQ